MKALRIGFVDLDTSHPNSFIPVLRDMGHELAAVYDGGVIHPAGYAETFARDHGIGAVCGSLEEMIERIDVALVHSCDWDLHVERARPFVEAGKAVFIDKPLAGNVRDLRQLEQWVRDGARVTGGSSLRNCVEVQEWRALGIPQEEWVYALSGCAVDEFNYGIHAYALLHGLMGPGVEQARWLGEGGGQSQIELTWQDGRRGVVSVGKTAGYLPFYANIVTQKRVDAFKVDSKKLYRSLLETILPYLAGEAPEPIGFSELAEIEYAAIAAKVSRERSGAPVLLRDVTEQEPGYDGAAFAVSYRAAKYPEGR